MARDTSGVICRDRFRVGALVAEVGGGEALGCERRPPGRRALAQRHRPHRDLEATGGGTSPGPPAEHRRRRSGRSGRPRWRAPCRPRVSDRLLPLLAGASAALRLHVRAVRRELHGRRAARRRGLHRRPVPHRRGRLRGVTASGDLLPAGHPHGRAADGRPAGRPPSTRLLSAGDHRGSRRSGRRHHQGGVGARIAHRRRGRRPAVPARAPASRSWSGPCVSMP